MALYFLAKKKKNLLLAKRKISVRIWGHLEHLRETEAPGISSRLRSRDSSIAEMKKQMNAIFPSLVSVFLSP